MTLSMLRPERYEDGGQVCDYGTMRLAREFMRWLTTTFRCTSLGEYSEEHTEMDTLFPDDLDVA